MEELNKFVQQIKYFGHEALATAIEKSIKKQLTKNQTVPTLNVPSDAPEPIVPSNIFSLTFTFFDIDEEEIARQLTLKDFEIFSLIKVFFSNALLGIIYFFFLKKISLLNYLILLGINQHLNTKLVMLFN